MNKFTDHKAFEGKLVSAWLEPALRQVDYYGQATKNEETRFRFVVDETDTPLAVVSDRYALVQNRKFVAALDLAADRLGIRLEPRTGIYRNGRALYAFDAPEFTFQAPNDPSRTGSSLWVQNDYRGSRGLSLATGFFRFACSNGLVSATVAHVDSRRHVGDINILAFVEGALSRYVARAEADRLIAETLGNTRAPFWYPDRSYDETIAESKLGDAHIVSRIVADTPRRYFPDFQGLVEQYARETGGTLWSVAQAVSDLATHRMQSTATGASRQGHNFGADEWASRQLARILQDVSA